MSYRSGLFTGMLRLAKATSTQFIAITESWKCRLVYTMYSTLTLGYPRPQRA